MFSGVQWTLDNSFTVHFFIFFHCFPILSYNPSNSSTNNQLASLIFCHPSLPAPSPKHTYTKQKKKKSRVQGSHFRFYTLFPTCHTQLMSRQVLPPSDTDADATRERLKRSFLTVLYGTAVSGEVCRWVYLKPYQMYLRDMKLLRIQKLSNTLRLLTTPSAKVHQRLINVAH